MQTLYIPILAIAIDHKTVAKTESVTPTSYVTRERERDFVGQYSSLAKVVIAWILSMSPYYALVKCLKLTTGMDHFPNFFRDDYCTVTLV